MRERKRLSRILIALIALSLLVAPILGCTTTPSPSPSPEPGAPPETPKGPIKIGSLTDLTGPAASTVAAFHIGTVNYFTLLNEENGGINGHPVEVEWADTKYEIPAGITAYERMKDEGVVCYTGMMTGIMMALTERLVEDGIPWAMAARNASPFMWPVKPFFAYHTCDADVTVMFLEWFWENKLGKAHPVKIAAIYLDTPYGRAALDGGVREWIKDNPEIVDFPSDLDFPVPMTTTDLTPELTKIKAANVDLIVQEVLKPQVEPLFGGLIKQDMAEPVFAMASQAGATFPEAIQKAPPGGQYSTETTPYTWEVDNPMIQSVKAMYDKITPSTEWELEWVEGWIVAELMREGISRALSNVGYDNLDAAAMYSALEAMKNFEPWHGGLPPISYSPTDHRGITMTRVYFTTGDKSPEYRMWPITDPLPTPTIIPPGVK